jgi:hypothetical protein
MTPYSLVPTVEGDIITIYPEDEDSMFFRNAGTHLPDYTMS